EGKRGGACVQRKRDDRQRAAYLPPERTMTNDRWDTLLDRDWSEAWESLPEAPDLVPRGKTAQITLRLPTTMLARIKRVAAIRSLPYHALSRSWIVDGLRRSDLAHVDVPDGEGQRS